MLLKNIEKKRVKFHLENVSWGALLMMLASHSIF